jgi:hypothetical protein
MSDVITNGAFITFPVISVTQKEDGSRVLDRFPINVRAKHIVGVNGLDMASRRAADGGQSTVHFETESGMRPIISEASVESLMEAVEDVSYRDFVSFDVVSVSEDEKSGERLIGRYTGYVIPDIIVGVNDLDGTYQQVTDDVRSIIYFKPSSGIRPTLSSEPAGNIMARINDMCFD